MKLDLLCIAVTVLPLLTGCYAFTAPDNDADLETAAYLAERRDMPSEPERRGTAERMNLARCTAPAGPSGVLPTADLAPAPAAPLSPGDVVRINLPGDDAPTGSYKVGLDGTLVLDGLGSLDVRGLTAPQTEAAVARLLVARGHFRPGYARVSLKLLDRGAVRVLVGGAVFQPGRVTINTRQPNQGDTLREAASGDFSTGRSLSTALSAASGVRPDADVSRVAVVRQGRRDIIDLTGFLTGAPTNDLELVDGDRVEVPTRGCFQALLARPSPITPPGVRVFISNLVVPASNNAGAAVGRDSSNLPYGTRLLQAAIGANCVGGTRFVNADRYVVLVSTNPANGESEVIERRLEALMRRRDRDGFNPLVLPNDAIACYDSHMTNVRDLIGTLSNAALAVTLGRL